MRNIGAVFLSFAASALAYQVVVPNASQGWTDSGPQTLTWNGVDTDPKNFTVFLTNEDRSVMPMNNQALAAQVDGSLLTVSLNPPNPGWPVGKGFQVNLCKSPEEPNTILAQSGKFDILPPKAESTSSSSTTLRSSTTTIPLSAPTTSPSSGTTADPTDANPLDNSASVVMGASSGLLSVLALLGFFLA